MQDIAFSVGYSILSNNSDIEDPCDIALELTVAAAQTIYEYYDGSWSGISCAQDESYCDGTPVLTASQPDPCLTLDSATGVFSYTNCDHTEADLAMNSLLTCTLTSGSVTVTETATQLITLKDNELVLRDCNPQAVTIHGNLPFTVYLDYEGDSSADFSDVTYTITYDYAGKPDYVDED